jgi:hypothetical protein
MTRALPALRALGLIAVAAAIADPGCHQPPRGRIAVATAGEWPTAMRQQAVRQLASAAPWADVVDEASPTTTGDAERVSARVVTGEPAAVIQALRSRPAALALRADTPSLTIASIGVPARVVTGMRADVAVTIGGVPSSGGLIRVVLRDAASGLEQGRITVPARATVRSEQLVVVPWLATRVGQARLRVDAAFEPGPSADGAGSAGGDDSAPNQAGSTRSAPPADVILDVRPAAAIVTVFEARPTWGARFARLALSGVEGVRLRSEVRVSPGVAVRTGPADSNGQPPGDDGSAEAEVILVGGLESLSAGDVSRLDRDVTDRGRAVVLLVDEAPAAGAWRRLWPDAIGPLRQSARLQTGLVAGHRWTMREWLTPVVSTGAAPLAYFDSGSLPFVVGRARGAGRIVVVTALDAWRWRAEEGTAYAAGWRALVQRLAADVPAPVTITAWATGTGRSRSIQADVSVRPDVGGRAGLTVAAELAGAPAVSVPLVRVEPGRWRGAVRAPSAGTSRLIVEARADAAVVGGTSAVVDVSPLAPAATWEDVRRHQSARGTLAAESGGLAAALDRLRVTMPTDQTRRWYVTRTWWFAGVALSLLGTEWILRRLYGER